MLAVSMGLEPMQFKPHLRLLRLVSAEIKSQCCVVADEISRARRTQLTVFMATFPEIVTKLGISLVDLDFKVLTSMCASSLVNRAAPGLRILASTPVEQRKTTRVRISTSSATDLVARYVLCTAVGAIGDHHAAELEALDRHELVVQLSKFPPSTRTSYNHWSEATMGKAARVNTWQLIMETADDHRGLCHIQLESVVSWWADRGRTVDLTAALLFLSYFVCDWCYMGHRGHEPSYAEAVMSLANGVGGDVIDMALASRTALLDLHAFLRQRVGDAPEQLQRELRRKFGATWTVTVKDHLMHITEYYEKVVRDCWHIYSSLTREILSEVGRLFQAMVHDIMNSGLPTETSTIVCRKWIAMIPANGHDIWQQLRRQVGAAVPGLTQLSNSGPGVA